MRIEEQFAQAEAASQQRIDEAKRLFGEEEDFGEEEEAAPDPEPEPQEPEEPDTAEPDEEPEPETPSIVDAADQARKQKRKWWPFVKRDAGAAATVQPAAAPEAAPPTPEEQEAAAARQKYFELKNNRSDYPALAQRAAPKDKKPKINLLRNTAEVTPEAREYMVRLRTAEEEYKLAKQKAVKEFLDKGEKEKAQEFLLREVELGRKNDIENKLVGKGERLMAGISKGIEKWDNWGKAEGVKGYMQRLAKTGISLAMIGAISGLSVEGLANMGIGTASALGGGITSYLGRRLGFGVGIAAVTALVPDKKKKWVAATLMAGTVGLTLASGGGIAAVGLVAASGIGLGLSRILKKYDKKIGDDLEKAKSGTIDLGNLENDITKMEQEMSAAIKSAERNRVFGKLRQGAVAIAGSMAALEIMGAVRPSDSGTAEKEAEERDVEPAEEPAKTDASPPTPTETVPPSPEPTPEKTLEEILAEPEPEPTPADASPAPETTPAPETPAVSETISPSTEGVTFEDGKGAIEGIQELRAQLREQYHGDYSNAPKGVQDFMQGTPASQAIKLEMYDPDEAAESALIQKGAVMKFDADGNLLFGKPGQMEILKEWKGDMLDSDKSGTETSMREKDSEFTPELREEIKEYLDSAIKPSEATGADTAITTPDEEAWRSRPWDKSAGEPGYRPTKDFTPEELAAYEEHIRQNRYEEAVRQARDAVKYPPDPVPSEAAPISTVTGYREPEGLDRYPRPGTHVSGYGFGHTGFFGNPGDRNFGLGNTYRYDPELGADLRYFADVSPEDNDFINQQHREFAQHAYGFSGEQVLAAIDANREDLAWLFRGGEHSVDWHRFADMKMRHITDFEDAAPGSDEHSIANYVRVLRNFSGVEPKGMFDGEHAKNYIARALLELSKKGALDEFRAAVRK